MSRRSRRDVKRILALATLCATTTYTAGFRVPHGTQETLFYDATF